MTQINTTDLQNPLQNAIARASKQDEFVSTILNVCGENYLPVSELIHKPDVRMLVEDANKLSIKLSDAYTRGKLGRVDHPVGTTRYAYGKPNTAQAMMSQKAPRSTMPRITTISAHKPYRIVLEFPDAEEALSFLMQSRNALKYVKNE